MSGNRIPELEDIIKTAFKEQIEEGKRHYLYSCLYEIEHILNGLLANRDNVCPYTIVTKPNGYARLTDAVAMSYIVKAKGANTKLLDINLVFLTDNSGVQTFDIDSVQVETITHLISDYESFIDYSNERVKKLADKLDSKSADFRNNLTSHGISVKDYIELMNEFNRLDFQTRQRLFNEARK